MSFFLSILLKLLPLYINILLGYIAGKVLFAQRDTVSKILFYVIAPIVFFTSVMRTDLTPSNLSLPILTFFLCSAISAVFYTASQKVWNDSTKNVLGFSAGTGNASYFGLPLAILLFNEQGEGSFILAIFGFTIFEASTGFYVLAQGIHSKQECLSKLLRLPQIYAFGLGVLFNLWNIKIPLIFDDYIISIKGTFAVLGMMVIGLAIAAMPDFKIDKKFLGLTFLAKFVIWPLVIFLILFIDRSFCGFYNDVEREALILTSIVPLAVNTVVLASILDVQPSKAASAVLLSTLFALLYTPVMCYFFITH